MGSTIIRIPSKIKREQLARIHRMCEQAERRRGAPAMNGKTHYARRDGDKCSKSERGMEDESANAEACKAAIANLAGDVGC